MSILLVRTTTYVVFVYVCLIVHVLRVQFILTSIFPSRMLLGKYAWGRHVLNHVPSEREISDRIHDARADAGRGIGPWIGSRSMVNSSPEI